MPILMVSLSMGEYGRGRAGVEIYITYKYGPVRPTAENNNLEVAGMRWIGVFRSEIKTFVSP